MAWPMMMVLWAGVSLSVFIILLKIMKFACSN